MDTKIPTQKDIENALIELGLKKGIAIEVHSSLSSFGQIEGGANTVISALMNVVGNEGALIMPTFPCSKPYKLTEDEIKSGITMKLKRLPLNSKERTGMGIIPDTFKFLPGVISGKGEHRVSAWGKDANIHSKGFNHLLENDGWALLIGVDIYRLTSMHYREDMLPQKIRDIFEAKGDILKDYSPEEWYIETGIPPVKAWYKIQDEADRRGYIHHHTIGNAKCMFFKARDVVDLYGKALEEDPFGLYEIKK
jgi:aminoglycoside N3'-acetyltransferase